MKIELHTLNYIEIYKQTLKSFEVGCVSAAYLSNIISTLAGKSRLNQWRIGLRILHVKKSNFIKFDITDFYSSIPENLLSRAISYARTIISKIQ